MHQLPWPTEVDCEIDCEVVEAETLTIFRTDPVGFRLFIPERWPVRKHGTCRLSLSPQTTPILLLNFCDVSEFLFPDTVGAGTVPAVLDMPTDDTRLRKACRACGIAKAKCTFENNRDVCYRCHRLNKECVLEETLRKKGTRTRSRVKQLEERVESLIGLLAAKGEGSSAVSSRTSPPSTTPQHDRRDDINPNIEIPSCSWSGTLPSGTFSRHLQGVESFEPYDPVSAGIISEDDAALHLAEFRTSFVNNFPFVVIPSSTDADTLRKQQPFLFLSIMAVMSYTSAAKQRRLVAELRDQIACRIIGRSHKSLEILQGLLVYVAWYHFFYRPESQQLAIVLQLCVALVCDLALSKKPRDKAKTSNSSVDRRQHAFGYSWSSAPKRALLGTFYLSAVFAQAWRKRSTMRHTRYIAQCAQSLAESQEYPSDMLINPMVQLGELLCRINDYFSYDDIENAEIGGDMMLQASTANFRSELERIRNPVSELARDNMSLKLQFCLLDLWIHEVALHSCLWSSSSPQNGFSVSPSRSQMLYRCLNAMKSYLSTLLAADESTYHRFAFPTWSGWLYASIVGCKVVFLEDNERQAADFDMTPCGANNLLPETLGPDMPHEFCSLPNRSQSLAVWDPVAVAEQADFQSLLDRFNAKFQFTVPSEPDVWTKDNVDFNPLFCIAGLQRSLANGFAKRLKQHTPHPHAAQSKRDGDVVSNLADQGTQDKSQSDFAYGTQTSRQTSQLDMLPFLHNMHFNSLNFDSIAMTDVPLPQQDVLDDWIWDMAMDDFTIPPL